MLGQEVHSTRLVLVVVVLGLHSLTAVRAVVRSMKVVLVVQLVEPRRPALVLARVLVLVRVGLHRLALELALALALVEVPQERDNHRWVDPKWASNHHRRVHYKVLERQQEPQLEQEQEQVWLLAIHKAQLCKC